MQSVTLLLYYCLVLPSPVSRYRTTVCFSKTDEQEAGRICIFLSSTCLILYNYMMSNNQLLMIIMMIFLVFYINDLRSLYHTHARVFFLLKKNDREKERVVRRQKTCYFQMKCGYANMLIRLAAISVLVKRVMVTYPFPYQ